jgi:hypothetical protein
MLHTNKFQVHLHSCKKELFLVQIKGKVHRITFREGKEGKQRYTSTLSLTLALARGGWLRPRTSQFTLGTHLVPIVQKAGKAPRAVSTGAKNSPLLGFCGTDYQLKV